MSKIVYTFLLTEDENIEMQLIDIPANRPEDICYDAFTNIFFKQTNTYTLLAYDTLNEACILLNVSCKEALKQKYYFDEKNFPDIGLIYNDAIYKKVRTNYKDKSLKDTLDCTNKLVVWSPVVSKNNMQTWMYNDVNGQIVLFIAPIYPFTFTSNRVKGYMSYAEWIKTYKPFVKRIISPETAQEWIKQTDEIMTLIQKNSESNSKKNIHDDVGRPKNGQKALDNSIAFKQTSSVRVSVSDNQLVILTKTKDNVSHGHVAGWHDLELAMQDALLDAGLVTQYGKILCKN
ncbi:MAG TPA: hypothetical protein VL201_01520 [Patescibacteria group bacterium]|jgi:hypothetical protein|nr:hypothetical protein [Patescibacteria group bacterium]